MIGLIILGIAGLYVAAWVLITRRIRPRWGKALAVLVAVAIPTWDLPFGYYRFHALCESEAGIQSAPGFKLKGPGILANKAALPSAFELVRSGHLQFVDVVEPGGNAVRWQLDRDGKERKQPLSAPAPLSEAPHLMKDEGYRYLHWHIIRYDYLKVYDRATDQKVASVTAFDWRGGWIRDNALREMPGVVASCQAARKSDFEKFLNSTD